jgi:hypothetical protein
MPVDSCFATNQHAHSAGFGGLPNLQSVAVAIAPYQLLIVSWYQFPVMGEHLAILSNEDIRIPETSDAMAASFAEVEAYHHAVLGFLPD